MPPLTTKPQRRQRHNGAVIAALAVWTAASVTGLLALASYAATPGQPPTPTTTWPDDTPLQRNHAAPTLVVFLHPRCPCSPATLAELARALATTSTPVRTTFVMGRPAGATPEWTRGPLEAACDRFTRATRIPDPDGRIAATFGATTSGHCMLFDASGTLTFTGGVTGARAHEGDNAGRAALVHAIDTPDPITQPASSPVFGCPLILPDKQTDACDACCEAGGGGEP